MVPGMSFGFLRTAHTKQALVLFFGTVLCECFRNVVEAIEISQMTAKRVASMSSIAVCRDSLRAKSCWLRSWGKNCKGSSAQMLWGSHRTLRKAFSSAKSWMLRLVGSCTFMFFVGKHTILYTTVAGYIAKQEHGTEERTVSAVQTNNCISLALCSIGLTFAWYCFLHVWFHLIDLQWA